MEQAEQQSWPAPAKINLFLHITAQRSDGYHELQTAFQFIDYSDQLQFTLRQDGEICRHADIDGVSAEADICVKAAKLLQQKSGITQGVEIRMDKNLPIGGGLGGGSSDAATTLLVLNHLWGANLPQSELMAMGLQLGADVPVFINGFTAWAEGVGEKLEPIEWETPWYLIVVPPVSVSTQSVFAARDLTRSCPPITIRDLVAGRVENVCETVVRRMYAEVDQALQWLSAVSDSRMSGTGACVYGRFDSQQAAQQAKQQFQQEFSADWQAVAAVGVNRSPLHEKLAAVFGN